MSISHIFLRSVLSSAARLGAAVSPFFVDEKKVLRMRDIFYSESKSNFNTLDIYKPVGSSHNTLPITLFVHGGGFGFFSKDSHAAAAAQLAEQGHLVFSINYRLTPDSPYPHALLDTIQAYRWILENAGSHGGNLQNISMIGESAGANLILALTLWLYGFDDGSSGLPENPAEMVKPKHLIVHCGHLHVSNSERYASDHRTGEIVRSRVKMVQSHYLPGSKFSGEDRFGLADPLIVLEDRASRHETLPRDFPSVFIPVGDRDPVIGDSERLGRVLQALNIKSELKLYPGVGHAFYALPFLKQSRECWKDIGKFLKA